MHTMPVVAMHCKQYHLKINKNIFSQRVYEYLTKPNQYQFRAHRNRFSNDFYLRDIVRFSHMTTENLKRKPTQTKQNSCLKQTLLTLYTQTGQRSMVTNCKQQYIQFSLTPNEAIRQTPFLQKNQQEWPLKLNQICNEEILMD